MAANFEIKINQAIADKVVASAAVMAVNRSGQIFYTGEFGKAGIEPDARPMTIDTTFYIASSTKLMTAIAALQCVERGLLKLDEPVSSVIPETESLEILTGFDTSGKPVLKKPTKQLTLSHLLTHSSGLGYAFTNPSIQKCRDAAGRPPIHTKMGFEELCFNPLSFEPGEGWEYGVNLEVVGQMIERVNDGISLQDYMQKNILGPLEMTSTTFRPLERPDMMQRLHGRVGRGSDGKLKLDTSSRAQVEIRAFDHGGASLYSCARDYIRVLRSLLVSDGKLLKPETVELLATPRLSDASRKALQTTFEDPHLRPFMAPGAPKDQGLRFDHALGGAVVTDTIDGQVDEGTIFWSGLPNNQWYIDFKTGVAGFYGTFVLPAGDRPTGTMYGEFRKAMYTEVMKDR